jgi:hypothetical protein
MVNVMNETEDGGFVTYVLAEIALYVVPRSSHTW